MIKKPKEKTVGEGRGKLFSNGEKSFPLPNQLAGSLHYPLLSPFKKAGQGMGFCFYGDLIEMVDLIEIDLIFKGNVHDQLWQGFYAMHRNTQYNRIYSI